MESAASKYSVYPKVGQAVIVLHGSTLDAKGNARLERRSKEARTIKQVHLTNDGQPSITDNVGETWTVRPGKLGEWETCFPSAESVS